MSANSQETQKLLTPPIFESEEDFYSHWHETLSARASLWVQLGQKQKAQGVKLGERVIKAGSTYPDDFPYVLKHAPNFTSPTPASSPVMVPKDALAWSAWFDLEVSSESTSPELLAGLWAVSETLRVPRPRSEFEEEISSAKKIYEENAEYLDEWAKHTHSLTQERLQAAGIKRVVLTEEPQQDHRSLKTYLVAKESSGITVSADKVFLCALSSPTTSVVVLG